MTMYLSKLSMIIFLGSIGLWIFFIPEDGKNLKIISDTPMFMLVIVLFIYLYV